MNKVLWGCITYVLIFSVNLLANCMGYSGPGGPCSTGPGGGLSTGPGGGAYTGPGSGVQINGIVQTLTANRLI